MKKNVLNLFLVTAIAFGAVSCNDKQNKTEAQEEADAAEASEMAETYIVDINQSTIDWQGEKPTGTHTGTIQISNGTLFLNDENEIESGDFTIDMKTIVVTDLEAGDGKEDLEAHLKGTVEGKEGDFFDVNRYPESNFEVTGIKNENGKQWLQGNLTIKEITKNIEFPVNVSLDNNRLQMQSESFSIDRTQWEVNFGSKSVFDNLGDKFINDDIELVITVVAEKA